MPDYSEVIALQQREAARRGPSPAELALHRQRQQTIVMKMEQLLAADEWTTYTAHVAALRERDEAQLVALRERIEQGEFVGEALGQATLRLHGLRSRLDAYRDALAIPAAVVAQAAEDAERSDPAAESA